MGPNVQLSSHAGLAQATGGGHYVLVTGGGTALKVLDSGNGPDADDRTTFTGFEGGGGIITSDEYCEAQIWAENNDRTWPVTGQVKVH